MDVFKVPLLLEPEERKTVQATFSWQQCRIRFPGFLVKRKKYLLVMVDQAYWRVLAQHQVGELAGRTAELNQLYFRLNYNRIRYHRQFRRWGSCSALKNINISHRLIGAPENLRDYVILHELAHLRHLNHGKEFWKLLATTGFNHRAIRKEITIYGRSWQREYYQWYNRILESI